MYDSTGLIEFLSMLFNLGAIFCGFKIIQGFLQRGEPPSTHDQNPDFFAFLTDLKRNATRQTRHTKNIPTYRSMGKVPMPNPKIRNVGTSVEQGEEGEYLIFESLERLDGHNRILVNLYLPQSDGTTTEVDLVMINGKGVHVFESKNYSGWIFGSEKNKYWTQVLKGGKKSQFYNPIWQNAGHIRAISNLCPGLSQSSCSSYIIFSDRCGLKELHVTNQDVFIGYRYELTRLFNSIVSRKPDRLTEEQVNEIHRILCGYIHVDAKTREKHIRQFEDKPKK